MRVEYLRRAPFNGQAPGPDHNEGEIEGGPNDHAETGSAGEESAEPARRAVGRGVVKVWGAPYGDIFRTAPSICKVFLSDI